MELCKSIGRITSTTYFQNQRYEKEAEKRRQELHEAQLKELAQRERGNCAFADAEENRKILQGEQILFVREMRKFLEKANSKGNI